MERTQSLFGLITKAVIPIPVDPDPRDFADHEDPHAAYTEACAELEAPRWKAMAQAEYVGTPEALDVWLGELV